MAASTLRVVRRPKGSPVPARSEALTAASQLITDPYKDTRSVLGGPGRANWQHEAWDMMDLVGELRFFVGWLAASCSRVRLIASEIDPDTGLPTGGISDEAGPDGKRAQEIVKAIAGGPLGVSQLLKRAAECLAVPGELWVAILDRGETNYDGSPKMCWYALTREEWKTKTGNKIEIELTDGSKHEFKPNVDTMFRIWRSRPRRAKEADSSVRACLDSLREIVRTTRKIRNADKSRLIGNGILFLPSEMSLPSAHAPVPDNQPGVALPTVTGVPAADQLNTMLYNVAKVAIEDEESQAAFIPIMATVPGDYLEKVQHLDFGKDITDLEIKKRNDSVARLALGLDVSPERLLGVGATTNHWSAWEVGDQDVQMHVKPPIELFCQAVQDQVVRFVMEREGIDPGKFCLWYDTSQLTIDPDKTDEATAAHEAGAITSEALRGYFGLADDDGYDFTSLEGWQVWAADAVHKNPELITTLLPLLDTAIQGLDFPVPQPALPPGQQVDENGQPVDDNTGSEPNTENKDTNTDQKAAASLVRRPPAELILAERLLVTRALSLAGKRRVKVNDRAQKARLAGVAAHEYHRFMPPVSEAEIPKLIAGWDEGLEDEIIAQLGVDTEDLREAVRRQIRAELTRPVVEGEVG